MIQQTHAVRCARARFNNTPTNQYLSPKLRTVAATLVGPMHAIQPYMAGTPVGWHCEGTAAGICNNDNSKEEDDQQSY